MPDTPSIISSGIPPISVDTIAFDNAIEESIIRGISSSLIDGKAMTSALFT